MSTQPVEEVAAAYFSFAVLDELADAAAAQLLALWALRPDLSEDDVAALVVSALISMIVSAEATGRIYGDHDASVPPATGLQLPTVPTTYRKPPAGFEVKWSPVPNPSPRADPLEVTLDFPTLEKRLTKAVQTLVEQAAPIARVERVARDEPIQAAQRGYQDAIRTKLAVVPSLGITGYRRGLNPDACELCFWLWKEGYVYPLAQSMHRHTGCRCWPILTSDRIGGHDLSPEDQQRLGNFMDRFDPSPTKKETAA